MLCRKQNEPLNRYSRAPYGLLTTDYRSLYSFSKTICTWDARARAQALQASNRTKLGSEKRGKKEKLQTASPSSSSLPCEDSNGKLTLPKHERRIQAATNCSFFLSQNQIEQKKLLPETFFVFFLNLFFPEDKLLGHHQNSESVPRFQIQIVGFKMFSSKNLGGGGKKTTTTTTTTTPKAKI